MMAHTMGLPSGRKRSAGKIARAIAAGAATAIPFIFPESTHASQSIWNGSTGNWSDPANWMPAGVPPAGADVLLINGLNPTARVTADISGIRLNSLIVDGTNGGQTTLSLSPASGSFSVGSVPPPYESNM